jgi:hypothetical protein
MSQNQISVYYHIWNAQYRTIITKFDLYHINVIPKMEENKYHDNIMIATTLMKICSG